MTTQQHKQDNNEDITAAEFQRLLDEPLNIDQASIGNRIAAYLDDEDVDRTVDYIRSLLGE